MKAAPVKVDFSNVKIDPIFTDMVDFETFSKSDFRAVKILACEAVEKSKKLLKFTLDDCQRKDRVIYKWRKLHSLLWSFRHFLYCIMRIKNI